MSARKAKRPRIPARRAVIYHDDHPAVEKLFSADASVAGVRATVSAESFERFLYARSVGREVRVSEAGGETRRIGVLICRFRDDGVLLEYGNPDEPLVFTPDEFVRYYPSSAWALTAEGAA